MVSCDPFKCVLGRRVIARPILCVILHHCRHFVFPTFLSWFANERLLKACIKKSSLQQSLIVKRRNNIIPRYHSSCLYQVHQPEGQAAHSSFRSGVRHRSAPAAFHQLAALCKAAYSDLFPSWQKKIYEITYDGKPIVLKSQYIFCTISDL